MSSKTVNFDVVSAWVCMVPLSARKEFSWFTKGPGNRSALSSHRGIPRKNHLVREKE
jgi:hypothetical protein